MLSKDIREAQTASFPVSRQETTEVLVEASKMLSCERRNVGRAKQPQSQTGEQRCHCRNCDRPRRGHCAWPSLTYPRRAHTSRLGSARHSCSRTCVHNVPYASTNLPAERASPLPAVCSPSPLHFDLFVFFAASQLRSSAVFICYVPGLGASTRILVC